MMTITPRRGHACILLLATLILAACQGDQTTRVVRVIDGDTIDVRTGNAKTEHIRIIGINTPETVDPRKKVQCFGPEASRRMHEIADGKTVTLEAKPGEDRDKYGRLLRYVTLDGRDLGARMIAEGFAQSYRHFPHPRLRTYDQLESQARSSGLGLWSACPHRARHSSKKHV